MAENILEIEDLRTYFYTEAGVVKAVDGVDLTLRRGETLGLVGESGSGKTVTALSILRTVPRPGRIVSGRIRFDGEDLVSKPEHEMRKVRGKKIAMVFQDPNSSLDPVYSVEQQLTEVIRVHQNVTKEESLEKAVQLLELVGIPEPRTRVKQYPHELSGGMRQRVGIARALSSRPSVLLADEPTTNLDVTVQAQVLDLIKRLKNELRMSLVMITHDMGIIAEMADRVTVLYAGRVAETGDTSTIFNRPRHPYTEALLNAVPRLDQRRQLQVIPGIVPNLIDPPSGCRFHTRCKYAKQICVDQVPPLEEIANSHDVSCHRWKEIYEEP